MLSSALEAPNAVSLPFAPSVPLMQARDVRALPRGEDWMYELLWGGERVRAVKHGTGVRVLSRDGKDFTNRFPRVAAALAKLRAAGAILDGEILYLDGCSSEALSFLAQAADDLSATQVVLLAGDLLCENARDIRPLSLLCRRVLLASVVQGTPILVSPVVRDSPESALALAARLGLRGVVAKRSGSAYRPNSLSHDWVKVLLPGVANTSRIARRRGPP